MALEGHLLGEPCLDCQQSTIWSTFVRMNDSLRKTGVAEVGHTHADVSGGALRASVFGGMDGLVTNIALVAGVGAAGASPSFIVLTGIAGLVAGAFSMAMGEYTSVKTQNEQLDREWVKEREEIDRHPVDEERELAQHVQHHGHVQGDRGGGSTRRAQRCGARRPGPRDPGARSGPA